MTDAGENQDRRFRMMRLGAGDWLCPSNDLLTMWRFHTFEDGRVHGLEVDYDLRTFWRAISIPMSTLEDKPGRLDLERLPDKWSSEWTEADWYLPTRAACITLMLKREAEATRKAADS